MAIWNFRVRNAAICDFVPRFSAEPVVRVAIYQPQILPLLRGRRPFETLGEGQV